MRPSHEIIRCVIVICVGYCAKWGLEELIPVLPDWLGLVTELLALLLILPIFIASCWGLGCVIQIATSLIGKLIYNKKVPPN